MGMFVAGPEESLSCEEDQGHSRRISCSVPRAIPVRDFFIFNHARTEFWIKCIFDLLQYITDIAFYNVHSYCL